MSIHKAFTMLGMLAIAWAGPLSPISSTSKLVETRDGTACYPQNMTPGLVSNIIFDFVLWIMRNLTHWRMTIIAQRKPEPPWIATDTVLPTSQTSLMGLDAMPTVKWNLPRSLGKKYHSWMELAKVLRHVLFQLASQLPSRIPTAWMSTFWVQVEKT